MIHSVNNDVTKKFQAVADRWNLVMNKNRIKQFPYWIARVGKGSFEKTEQDFIIGELLYLGKPAYRKILPIPKEYSDEESLNAIYRRLWNEFEDYTLAATMAALVQGVGIMEKQQTQTNSNKPNPTKKAKPSLLKVVK